MNDIVRQVVPDECQLKIQQLEALSDREFPLKVFDSLIIDFLNELSKKIFAHQEFNKIAAIAALAFYLRKSNTTAIFRDNQHLLKSSKFNVYPAGIVFHVCPSNVDTMFLYSLAISLLAGNKNILRISDRVDHPYLIFLFSSINEIINSGPFSILKKYINIIRYGHDDTINRSLSMQVDVRIIWGGDSTTDYFRSIKPSSRTKDIIFADRISYSILNCGSFLSITKIEQKEIIRKFFNDSYTFDQKGCSSPQLLFFIGNNEQYIKSYELFYSQLSNIASTLYNNDPASLISLKINQLFTDVMSEKIQDFKLNEVNVLFAGIKEVQSLQELHSCGGGYFYIKKIDRLNDILPFINRKIQTLSYYGLDKNEIQLLADISNSKGIDRIVPFGKSLDFDNIWDGYNLIEELTLKKTVL